MAPGSRGTGGPTRRNVLRGAAGGGLAALVSAVGAACAGGGSASSPAPAVSSGPVQISLAH